MRAAMRARDDYDFAAERGYPPREAAAMKAADAALAAAAAQYPGAAAYASAQSFKLARNDRKASAGDRAVRAIEAGADPAEALAAMRAEWAAAARAVENS